MDLTNIKGIWLQPISSGFKIQLWFELTQVTLDFIAKYLKRLIRGTDGCKMKKNVRKLCARHLLTLQAISMFWSISGF